MFGRNFAWVLLLGLAAPAFGIDVEDCEDGLFHLDPDNCPHSYFRCYKGSDGEWKIEKHDCPAGTAFNPAVEICDWEDNVPDNVCDGVTHKPTGPTEKPTTTEEGQTTSMMTDPPSPGNKKRLVCYFGAWAFYRPGHGKFDIGDIDPHLCTHVCYSFANMNNQTWKAIAYDPWFDLAPWDDGCDGDHCHYDSFRRFTALKKQNKDLKTLLSMGGWNTGSEQWSVMAADPHKRKIFIESSVELAQKFDFDGIDFDWEYPGSREGSDPDHDKEAFTLLVEEFGAALHAEKLILTAATSPDPVKAGNGYDIPRVFAAMDFVNVMDYDYHGAWDEFTGVNTPLYGRTEEDDPNHPGHFFNINDTVHWYINQGAPREKINIGTAAYGRGFVLPKGTAETGLYCPTEGPMPGGPYTGEDGMWGYLEILQAFNNDSLPILPDATPKDWTTVVDGCYLAPYATNGPYWIGYDNEESVTIKTQFANYLDVGGAMMFALDLDDFRGDFGEKYPLTKTVKKVLESGEVLDADHILGENSGCESAPICNINL